MKNLRLIICFGLVAYITISCNEDDSVAVNEPQSCLPVNLQNGLIAAYSFSGGSVEDAVGSANLTIVNAQSTTDRQGNDNCAYVFQGNNNSYLTSQNTAFLNDLNEMTVALWYLPQGEFIDYELLLGRGEGYACDTYGEWSLGVYDARKAVFGHGNSVWEQINPLNPNQWKFVTATVKKANNTTAIYINGVLEQTETGILNCPGNQPMTVEDIGNLLIGVEFNGKIDDIVIYNRVLTQAEIIQLYELAPCCE